MTYNRQIMMAKIISLVFSPVLTVGMGMQLLLYFTFDQGWLGWWQLMILSLVIIYFPLTYFFISIAKGRIDADLTKRQARLRFLVFGLACGFLGLFLSFYFSAYLFRVFLALTITALAFVLVTFWDRASIHVGGSTSFYLVLNLLSQWRYFYLLPIIPLVGWARLFLGKHETAQIFEGFVIPLIAIPAGFYLLQIT